MPFPSLIVLCAYSLILMVFVTGSEKPSENKFFLFDFASVDFLRIIAFGKDFQHCRALRYCVGSRTNHSKCVY